MKKFKLLVLVLIVALGVTACTTDKTPDDKAPVEEPGKEAVDEPVNDDEEDAVVDETDQEVDETSPEAEVVDSNPEGNAFLKDIYDNRVTKVSYDGVSKFGDMEASSKYYIDGENYRVETDNMVSIYNSKDKKIYTYDTETMEGTIQTEENLPPINQDFQGVPGLEVAELRDYEGEEQVYVESVGNLEGEDFITKSWISKKYYINLKGEALEDGEAISTLESSNISEDFDSKMMFQEPKDVDFKESK